MTSVCSANHCTSVFRQTKTKATAAARIGTSIPIDMRFNSAQAKVASTLGKGIFLIYRRAADLILKAWLDFNQCVQVFQWM